MNEQDLCSGDTVYVRDYNSDAPEWEAYKTAVVSSVSPVNGTVFIQLPGHSKIAPYKRSKVLSSKQFFELMKAEVEKARKEG